MRWLTISLLVFGAIAVPIHSQTIATVAGNGSYGFSGDSGSPAAAKIDTANGVAVDGQGNVFIADTRNHRVRKVTNGTIATVAGTGQEGFSGDGSQGTSAQLSFPRGLAVDGQGNLYIADTGNSRIRKLSPAGVITTVAGTGTAGFAGDGGAAASAQLNYPRGLAFDSKGNLYVADSWNFRVRKIGSSGTIQTFAGNGSCGPFGDGGAATDASLGLIDSLAFDSQGNLYLSDVYQHTIRKVASDGTISTAIGGGFGTAADGTAATAATLKFPKGLATDSQGSLLLADTLNHRVRKILPDGGIGTVAGTGTPGYAGDGSAAISAQLDNPTALAADPKSSALYIADLWNYRIRQIGGGTSGPAIDSVANAAGGQPVITGGSYVQIKGSNLSSKQDTWTNAIVNSQLPTQLDGVSVTVGGKPAYIYYVSPGQINILTPDVAAGTTQVQVTNSGATSAPFSVAAQQYSPAFYLWGSTSYAVATHTDYSGCGKAGLISGYTTTPAKPGEWITLWGNGFGPTDIPSGMLTPIDKTHSTAPVTATVGGLNAAVYGGNAVLTPGGAGLFQVSVQIPAGTRDGDVVVRATVGGVQTPDNVFLTVHQ